MDAKEIEEKILQLVKIKHQQCGGANGLEFYELDNHFDVDFSEIRKTIDKLVSEKKIIFLNHLNGKSLTLPK